jgi:uncharacterized coiled-coil protein SlyX
MSNSDALEEATARLTKALDTFGKTVAERRHADLAAEALQEQIEALSADLGAEREKSERMAAANDEVSERLDSVIESVKAILENQGSSE